MKSHLPPILILCVLGAWLGGCTAFSGLSSPTPVPDWAYTQAAQTIIAGMTLEAPPATPTPPLPPTEVPTLVPTLPPPSPTNSPVPTSTPEPSLTPTLLPTATEAAGVPAFEEDFNDGSGWAELEDDGWEIGYANGGYSIFVDITNAPIWSIRRQELDDVRLEVDAARTAGPENGYYGLVCRHLDGDNYYTLVISDDGFFGIGIVEDGDSLSFLQQGTAPVDVLKPEGTPNHLRADCMGETLTLYANGIKLAEVTDDTFDSGDSGLLAGTRGEAGLRVLFDNLTARIP